MLALCYVAVQQWFPQSWWSRLFGIVAVIWGAGSLLGPLIGGVFASLHAWRMTFLAFAALAVVLCGLASLWLPAPTRAAGQPAGRLPVRPLLALLTATVLIAGSGVASGVLLAFVGVCGGVALLYAAARLDRRSGSRLFPPQILNFRHPVGAGLWMVFALSAATTGFWAYGPLILKILFGTQPLMAGYILAGEGIAWSLATVAVSKAPVAADRQLIRVGTALTALGAGGFAIVMPAGPFPGIVLCALLQGFGFGLCWPSIVHRMARCSNETDRPVAVTAPETMQRIGYAVGTAAVGIAANLSGLAAGTSVAAAKTAAVWVFAAFVPLLMAALVCAWRFTREAVD